MSKKKWRAAYSDEVRMWQVIHDGHCVVLTTDWKQAASLLVFVLNEFRVKAKAFI